MSEVKKDEYIEISLTKMLVTLIKNIKIFMVVLVLGVLLSMAGAFMYTPSYKISQLILIPTYLSGDKEVNIISKDKVSVLLNNILDSEQQKAPNDSILQDMQLTTPNKLDKDSKPGDKNDIFFSLNTEAKENRFDKVNEELGVILNKFSNSSVLKRGVALWVSNINNQVDQNNKIIDRSKKDMKFPQASLDKVQDNTLITSTAAGQTLINAYASSINYTQSIIYKLQDDNIALKLNLTNYSAKVEPFANKTFVKDSKLSKTKILAVGVVLSILLSIFAVFVMTLIKSVAIEYKKSENS